MRINNLVIGMGIAASFLSCEKPLKNVKEYYPEVTTVSAIIQEDGSVEITGEIVSEGNRAIVYEGVCMDTLPSPEMTSNQKIASGARKSFSVSYPDLKEKTKYYFRTWAVNDNGYSYGNVVTLDSVVAPPVIAPCLLSPNSLKRSSSSPQETFGTISKPTSGFKTWTVQASATYTHLTFTFGSEIKTGIFTTTDNSSDPGYKKVYILSSSGSTIGSLDPGTKVYINKKSANSYEMSICDAPWKPLSSTLYFNSRCILPL